MTHRDFRSGSLVRHVLAMSAMSTVAMCAIYVGDLFTAFYISLQKSPEHLAAFGYSTTLLFFHTAVAIGLSIAVGARLSRGAGGALTNGLKAEATAMIVIAVAASALLAVLSAALLGPCLEALGASGQTALIAERYCAVALLSRPILTLGLCMTAALRALGHGRRAMLATIAGAVATLALDPLLILAFGMGIQGAATSNVLARAVLAGLSWHWLRRSGVLGPLPHRTVLIEGARVVASIGLPATLTQLAAACSNAIVLRAVGLHGVDAAAAWAVIERLSVAAFVMPLALAGAIGPIVGQNFGAGSFTRIRATLRLSLGLVAAYVAVLWLALASVSQELASVFGLRGAGQDLLVFFCVWVSTRFLFMGGISVSNSAFNYVGRPVYGTVLSWAHATLGTLPFVWIGSKLNGATGAIAGFGLGTAAFGVIAVGLCFRLVGRLEAVAAVSREPNALRVAVPLGASRS